MLGENIQNVRKAKNLTQESLASELEINRATLSKYESGTIEPPLSVLQRIANILSVPMSYLLGEGWGQVLAFDLQEKIIATVEERVWTVLSSADSADLYEVFGTYDNETAFKALIDKNTPLTLNQIEDISDQLGVPVEYLIGQLEDPDVPVRTTEEQQRFMKIDIAFDKLNQEGQQKSVERMEELTEIPKYQR